MPTTTKPSTPETIPEVKPDKQTPERVPSRPSPRPRHKPRPSTDPRQFITKLLKHYYGGFPSALKAIAQGAVPFKFPEQLTKTKEAIEAEMQAITAELHDAAGMVNPAMLVNEIRAMQDGNEPAIVSCIREFIEEIFGDNALSILPSLEMQLEDNDTSAVRNLLDLANNSSKDEIDFSFDPESQQYLIETIRRAEIYSLLVQGFSIAYMKSFIHYASARTALIPANLSEAYRKFFLISRAGQFSAFYMQLDSDGRSPFEPEHSLGESDVCYEPEGNPDNPDLVDSMMITGRATSPIGVVLAHEALKAGFQILTPWAKLRENYLDRNEWLALRLLINSPYAEARQFAMGPSIYQQIINGFHRTGIDTSLKHPQFFKVIEEWFSGSIESVITRFHYLLD